MLTISNLSETDYFLPEDGPQAEADFLSLVRTPGRVFIAAFGCTMPELFDALKMHDAAGHPCALLLDHLQSMGHAEARDLDDFFFASKFADVTITTAGINSRQPSQLWHIKGAVVVPSDGSVPLCWEGSVNFSPNGWAQGNTARSFRSQEWAAAFLVLFNRHRAYARESEAQYQRFADRFAGRTLPCLS